MHEEEIRRLRIAEFRGNRLRDRLFLGAAERRIRNDDVHFIFVRVVRRCDSQCVIITNVRHINAVCQ